MDIHKEIGRLPRPKKGFVLPGHKYTGPYNPLDEQLDVNDIPVEWARTVQCCRCHFDDA